MIRTTVVGGWPLPARYAESLEQYHRGELSGVGAGPILTAATSLAVREQLSTGVDQVTGGELFVDPFLTRLPLHLTGIEAVRDEWAQVSRRGSFYRLSGNLEAPRGIGFATAFCRQVRLDSRLSKATCPGPLTLLSFLILVDSEALSAIPEAVAIVRREVCGMAQAGAREIQLDAPMEITAVELFHQDPAVVADALGRSFEGVRNVTRTVHFCFGGLRGSATTPAQNLRGLLRVLAKLEGRIDRILLECVDDDARSMLGELPRGVELVAGVAAVDIGPEPVDVLVARTREVLRHVPAERLLLSPSCSLRSCTTRQAIGILTNLVAAAGRCG